MKYLSLLILLISSKGVSQIKYEYPELLVSPSASETVIRLAKKESKEAWKVHVWSQLPALMNLWTGYRALNETNEDPEREKSIQNAGVSSLALSGGWLALTMGVSAIYSYWQTSFSAIKKKCQQRVKEIGLLERGELKKFSMMPTCQDFVSSMPGQLSTRLRPCQCFPALMIRTLNCRVGLLSSAAFYHWFLDTIGQLSTIAIKAIRKKSMGLLLL